MALKAGISYIDNTQFQNQCTWELSVTDGVNTHTVGYPLTVDFSIVRNTFASANTATFSIYNLSPSTRSSDLFFQDRFNTSTYKVVTFKAGYNGHLITCFKGRMQESYTKRQGTEIITTMQCFDIGVPRDYINVTFEAGTTFKEAYKTIIENLGQLELGAIGSLEGEFKTPITFEGSALDVLNEITGGCTYIDNGIINTLQPNECLDTSVPILNADTGLLNIPQRRNAEIVAEGIFNPNVEVGQLIEVQSKESKFSGTFQLTGFTHKGTISGAVAGSRTTTYNFLVGAMMPNGNYATTGTTEKQPFTKVKKEEKSAVATNFGADVYGVIEYIRSHNGQPPTWKVGHTNFTWKQLLLPAGTWNTQSQVYSQVTVPILQNCKVIAEKLYDYVQVNLPGSKIKIVSNWRSIETNAKLKNASKESVHLRGGAIDFHIEGITNKVVFDKVFNKTWDKFTYMFRTKTDYNIHVQNTLGKNGALRIGRKA